MGAEVLAAIVDGALRPDGRVDVLALGAAFQHGEGLFETLPVLGGAPAFLDQHLERMRQGSLVLGLAPPPPAPVWRADIARLVETTGAGDLAVRCFVFDDGGRLRRCVAATRLPADVEQPAVVGRVDPDLDGPRALARVKTLNYLVPRLAHRRAAALGEDEALFTLVDGTVLEGTRSSFFIVREGTVTTSPLSLPILPGVTRDVLLQVARDAGIPLVEAPFTVEEAAGAEEAFLTSSLRGVRPVRRLFGRDLPAAGGSLIRSLQDLYRARLARELALRPDRCNAPPASAE